MNDGIKAICPFLGFIDDPSTRTSYASFQNVCHKARPLDTPNLQYQQNYCLSDNHVHCPVLWLMKKEPLPRNIRAPRSQYGKKKFLNWLTIPVFIALLAFLFFAGFFILFNNRSDSTADQSATETRVMELLASAEAAKWTKTPTPTVYMTETPNSLELTRTAFVVQQLSATPSPTPTNTPRPAATVAPPSQPNKPNPTKKPNPTPIPIDNN